MRADISSHFSLVKWFISTRIRTVPVLCWPPRLSYGLRSWNISRLFSDVKLIGFNSDIRFQKFLIRSIVIPILTFQNIPKVTGASFSIFTARSTTGESSWLASAISCFGSTFIGFIISVRMTWISEIFSFFIWWVWLFGKINCFESFFEESSTSNYYYNDDYSLCPLLDLLIKVLEGI